MSVMPTRVARVGIGTTIVAMCLVAVSAQRPADAPTSVAVYAGVGEDLITFEWGGVAPGGLKTIDDVRSAVVSGAIKSPNGSW